MVRSYLGHSPIIPGTCYVDVSAQIVGQVELGEHSSVWMNAVLRGDVHSIRLGANSNVQDCAVLHGMRYKHPVEVGDWVTIGHNATVHGCVIEDACLIGMGATILNNARIGEGLHYCRWGGGPGEHGGAGEHALGGCAGQRAAAVGSQRARGDPAICAELRGLHGDLSEGTGKVVVAK